MTVNPAKKKLSLMSIPRDTMARMIGTENFSVHKINAAYNIGGAKMAMNTTSKVLNVPIKYYISMNMGGMKKIVDGVGGVTVTPPLTFTYDGYTFNKGKHVHLMVVKHWLTRECVMMILEEIMVDSCVSVKLSCLF